jgi:hypothetical protein
VLCRALVYCTVVWKIWEVKWEFAGGGVGGSRFQLMGARGSRELRESQCFGGYSGERKFPGRVNFIRFSLASRLWTELNSRLNTR